jgi:heat shock protein HslJ
MAAAAFRAGALAFACAACTSTMVDERTFDHTRWHVTAIDGAPTPPSGDYHIEFSGRTIGGRFGCNGFGGSFSVLGDIMNAGDVRSTMMACSEPAAGFESRGFAVLRLPMQLRWSNDTHLTLSNSAGAIDLERAP